MPKLADLSPRDQERVLRLAAISLRSKQKRAAEKSWSRVRREDQAPPGGNWFTWLIMAGRGWGKTRTGAETVAQWMRDEPGSRIALVAQTFADGRDTMVEGESGLLAAFAPHELRGGARDTAWNRSMGELFLANESRAKVYSSEKPASLRGPQHHKAWGDEPAYWIDANAGDTVGTTWSNLKLGLRLGAEPQAIMTTTPRPVRLLVGTPDTPGLPTLASTAVTRGSSYDNLANLAPTFRANVLEAYEGTRLGRQELFAELLLDAPGALWTTNDIRYRPAPLIIKGGQTIPDLARIVVAVDPNATSGEQADEAGIVVAGLAYDGRGYVLDDRSARVGPTAWAKRALQAASDFGADSIVAESNNGGEMVGLTINAARRGDDMIGWQGPIKLVTASRGKRTRAEPIAMLYEQDRISHVRPMPELEYELTHWTPESGDSPGRLDALAWAFTELMLGGSVGDSPGDSFSMVA